MEHPQPHEPSWLEKLRFKVSLYSLTLLPHNPKTRPHWNEIVPGLILGGLPIETSIMGHGNHGEKLLAQCEQAKRPLGLVVSAIEGWELEGKGIGIKPVPRQFWRDNKVQHHHLHMQDFTGDANLEDIKKEVDAIDQARQQGKSAYVHCKAGRGRSYLVVFCYLMDYEQMDANQALETIYKARSQVSPSGRQFATIEQYRQAYCPDRKPLNMLSNSFYPYRKDMLSFSHSSKLHGLLVAGASYMLSAMSLSNATIAGFVAKYAVDYMQDWHNDYQVGQYQIVSDKAKKASAFKPEVIEAFRSGYEASSSWKHWGSAWLSSSLYLSQYPAYAAGYQAGKELDSSLLQSLKAEVEASPRSNPHREARLKAS